MKKLTAEKCRELLEEIKYNRENCFLSEKTKMLMDIAESVILEKQEQEQEQQKGEGWIEWGGKCGGNDQPVIGMVEVKFRNGKTQKSEASDWYWPHDGIESDIIAYRITPEQPTNQSRGQ